MAERFKAPVLKTGNPQGFVGSNPTPSAIESEKCFVGKLLADLMAVGPTLDPTFDHLMRVRRFAANLHRCYPRASPLPPPARIR